uniref:Uncharacterized protein n=1 Tax=Siphoviridae sp. ctB3v5 TaxID=2826186 RepID=A0A8S5M9S4_9CAUD|nr:MAG TPA: hypothetical protein [Siphoviridae sp. ctB3v5]
MEKMFWAIKIQIILQKIKIHRAIVMGKLVGQRNLMTKRVLKLLLIWSR